MVGRGAEEPSKPSDLSEAERERLKRQYRCAGHALEARESRCCKSIHRRAPAWRAQQLTALSCCRGVFWDRKTKRWRCQLGYQSKKIFLGYFDDAGEAARAYDQKLVELRGAGGGWALALQGVCLVGSAAGACSASWAASPGVPVQLLLHVCARAGALTAPLLACIQATSCLGTSMQAQAGACMQAWARVTSTHLTAASGSATHLHSHTAINPPWCHCLLSLSLGSAALLSSPAAMHASQQPAPTSQSQNTLI
jgi:hypothetical protein